MRKNRRQYRRKQTPKTDADRMGELKAALPTAGADFLIAELLKGSTVEQATKNYVAQLETQHRELSDTNSRLKAMRQSTSYPRLARA